MSACKDLEDAPSGYRCIEIEPCVVEWDVEAKCVKLPEPGDDFYSVWLETPAQVQDLIDALKVAIGWFPEAGDR